MRAEWDGRVQILIGAPGAGSDTLLAVWAVDWVLSTR